MLPALLITSVDLQLYRGRSPGHAWVVYCLCLLLEITMSEFRYKLLEKVIEKALDKSIENLTVDKLAEIYPSFNTPSGRKHLKNSISQINNFFLTSSRKEIDVILQEKNVKEKLQKLDAIVDRGELLKKENQQEQSIHVDTLTSSYLVEYKLLESKSEYKEKLEAKLDKLKYENQQLLEVLKSINDENHNILTDMDHVNRQMRGIQEVQDDKEWGKFFEELSRKELLI